MNTTFSIFGITLFTSQLFLQATGIPNSIVTEGLVGYLIQNAPALVVLIYFAYRKLNNEDSNLIWIKEQLTIAQKNSEEKEEEISKLNEYIRNSEKENLEIMSQMNSVIQALTSNVQLTNTKLSLEIQESVKELKQFFDSKLSK
jgi:hypothetical protein